AARRTPAGRAAPAGRAYQSSVRHIGWGHAANLAACVLASARESPLAQPMGRADHHRDGARTLRSLRPRPSAPYSVEQRADAAVRTVHTQHRAYAAPLERDAVADQLHEERHAVAEFRYRG